MWWIGTIIGALSLVTLNSFERKLEITFFNILILLPILIICNQGFWYGFKNAPNFMFCWILGSVIAGTFGWISNMLILHEPTNLTQIAGWMLSIAGLLLMKV